MQGMGDWFVEPAADLDEDHQQGWQVYDDNKVPCGFFHASYKITDVSGTKVGSGFNVGEAVSILRERTIKWSCGKESDCKNNGLNYHYAEEDARVCSQGPTPPGFEWTK